MKLKITGFLLLFLALMGCVPLITPADSQPELLLPDYLLGAVEITIKNKSNINFEDVILKIGSVPNEFGPIGAQEAARPLDLPFVYQSFTGSLLVDGEMIDIEVLDRPEETGETPIVAGSYVFEVEHDAGNDQFFVNLRPDIEPAQARLAPLVDLLEKGGGSVRYVPFIQRENAFSQGEYPYVSATEIFELQNGGRMLVFIFEDAEIAKEAADRIYLNTSQVQVILPEGRSLKQSVDFWSGDQPVWWQYSNVIVLADGRDNYAYEMVNNAFDSYPLGGQKAEFVATATPETPVVDGDLYMARLNVDENACNAALLTGDLIIEDGCVYIQVGDEKYLPVWPRTYSIDTGGLTPAVIGSDGEVVFKVGDRAYLGGSGVPAGNTYVFENLVDPLPNRCEAPAVWNACSYLPEEYRDEAVNAFAHSEVYAAVIDQLFDGAQYEVVRIRNRTGREGVPGYLPAEAESLEGLSAETLAGYHRANAGAKEIAQALPDQARYQIVWETEEFESVDLALHFSDVGFNEDRTQALVLVVNDCGNFSCRESFYVVVNKVDDRWEIGDQVQINS